MLIGGKQVETMVKNNSGGNKSKHKARKTTQLIQSRYEDLVPTEDQALARVHSVCGGGRYKVTLVNGETILGICCGKMKRGRRPKLHDLVCISTRDYQQDRCDILHLYTPEQVGILLKNDETGVLAAFCAETNLHDTSDGIDISFQNEENWDDL